jgi:hypothetical protein
VEANSGTPGGRELPSPLQQYHRAALRGEKLLGDEAEHGIRIWTSTTEISRLLQMRRMTWPPLPGHELWRVRVLDAIIPDLDHVVAAEQENPPTSALITTLLALVAAWIGYSGFRMWR